MMVILAFLLLALVGSTCAEWHGLRLPDEQCLNQGRLRCHAGGYQNSKLQGQYNRYDMRVNLVSGATAGPESTGHFSLSLHSHLPNNQSLVLRMDNDTSQLCTDERYCTLQTWWQKYSPKIHMTRDVARMIYPLTAVGDSFPFYDMTYNETVDMGQLYGAGWWNETIAAAYQGYSSVADLLDCDQPVDVQPFLQRIYGTDNPYVCDALQSSNPDTYNASQEIPFHATSMLPLDCARVALPEVLYDDLVSDIGAHDLRTAYDLLYQQQHGGGLPGTVDFIRPAAQLTALWQKFEAVWQFAARGQHRHLARAFPPCSSGSNPDTLILSHYYKIGPLCQLYRVATRPQWIVRFNITLSYDSTQVKPAFASASASDSFVTLI